MNKNSKIFILGAAVLSAGIVCCPSCKDDEEPEEVPEVENTAVDVYMAFNYDSLTPSFDTVQCAAIWKNGKIRKLSPGREENVRVEDMFVTEDGKVYAGGYFGENAVVWDNYSEVLLPQGRAVTGVSYYNGKIYACGQNVEGGKRTAMMWEGTEPKVLDHGVMANALYMGNNSCYIAGYGEAMQDGLQYEVARFWIDGKYYSPLPRTGKSADNTSEALDIINQGEVWWIVGREVYSLAGSLPKLWIKTTNNDLEKAMQGSRLTSIAYENGTYYMGGNSGKKAKYWTAQQAGSSSMRPTNVKSVELTDDKYQAQVTDIDVRNGVVYTCGYIMQKGNYQPRLWKNTEDILSLPRKYNRVEPKAVRVVPQLN